MPLASNSPISLASDDILCARPRDEATGLDPLDDELAAMILALVYEEEES